MTGCAAGPESITIDLRDGARPVPPLSCNDTGPWRWTSGSFALRECPGMTSSMPHLVADFSGQDVAEQMPGLAVELHQLHLLDRKEIIRRGVDLDTRQHHVA